MPYSNRLLEEKVKTLKDIRISKSATVVKLHGEGALRRRIMDMGMTKGVVVTVRKMAPLGDPMELRLRGYTLTLRLEDAARIGLKEVQA